MSELFNKPKILTLAQANAQLPQVIQMVKNLQQLQQELVTCQRQSDEMTTKLTGGNGYSRVALKDQLHAGKVRQDQIVAEVRAILLELDEFGALLKDPEVGLVDFYGQRADELIMLCWKIGEEERIKFWHTLEGGFAGRQAVDSLVQ